MTTISRSLLTLVFAGGLALGTTACSGGGGDKCEKAVDKMFDLMAEGMAEELGDEGAEEFVAQMKEQKPQAVEACKTELEKNPDKVKAGLDCVLKAETHADLEGCPEF